MTQTVTVDALIAVESVTVSVVDGEGNPVQPERDGKYTVALDDENVPKLQAAFTPTNATYQTGTWHSSDESIAAIADNGQIQLGSKTGTVEFWFVADNGTAANETDDKASDPLKFIVTAGDNLTLFIPQYAQDSLVQAGEGTAVSWVTNASSFYTEDQIEISVALYAGTDTTGTPVNIDVDGTSSATIPAENLTA